MAAKELRERSELLSGGSIFKVGKNIPGDEQFSFIWNGNGLNVS